MKEGRAREKRERVKRESGHERIERCSKEGEIKVRKEREAREKVRREKKREKKDVEEDK